MSQYTKAVTCCTKGSTIESLKKIKGIEFVENGNVISVATCNEGVDEALIGMGFRKVVESTEVPDFPIKKISVKAKKVPFWLRFQDVALLGFFAGIMSLCHLLGFFHRSVVAWDMLLCAVVCSSCMLRYGWKDYMKPLFVQLSYCWLSLLAMAMVVALGWPVPWLFVPWITMRLLLSDCQSEGIKAQIIDLFMLFAVVALPLRSVMLSLLVPIWGYHQGYLKKGDMAPANRGIALTLVGTFILSWAAVLFPAVMHPLGIHVFFHDALILLAVYEWGKRFREWVFDQAKEILANKHDMHVYRNGGWQLVCPKDINSGDYVCVYESGVVAFDCKVMAVQNSCTYLPSMKHNEAVVDCQVGSDLGIGAQITEGQCVVKVARSPEQDTQQARHDTKSIPQWFHPSLVVYATLVSSLCAFFYPALVLPVVSSIMMGACPCVFTVAEPLIGQMFCLYAMRLGVTVSQTPRFWSQFKVIIFDRTGTIAFPGEGGGDYEIDPKLKENVERLRCEGFQVKCLTAQSMSEKIDPLKKIFGEDNVIYGERYDQAEEKKKVVADLETQGLAVFYIGDGQNDVQALGQATQSLAVAGDVSAAKAADSCCDRVQYSYIDLLSHTIMLMSLLKYLAIGYNAVVIGLVSVYPLLTGAVLFSPAVSCLLMSVGSLLQLCGAFIGMESVIMKQNLREISISRQIIRQYVEKPIETVIQSINKRMGSQFH